MPIRPRRSSRPSPPKHRSPPILRRPPSPPPQQTADDGGVSAALKATWSRTSFRNTAAPRASRVSAGLACCRSIATASSAPIWTATPARRRLAPRRAMTFLSKGVAADGLDPADYPTPAFDDPQKLAADELALTASVLIFARHASMGRVAFSRVSGAVYFDQKAPAAADVLGKLAAAPTSVAPPSTATIRRASSTRRSRPNSPRSAAARTAPSRRRCRAPEPTAAARRAR